MRITTRKQPRAKSRQSRSKIEMMLTVFFDYPGLVHYFFWSVLKAIKGDQVDLEEDVSSTTSEVIAVLG